MNAQLSFASGHTIEHCAVDHTGSRLATGAGDDIRIWKEYKEGMQTRDTCSVFSLIHQRVERNTETDLASKNWGQHGGTNRNHGYSLDSLWWIQGRGLDCLVQVPWCTVSRVFFTITDWLTSFICRVWDIDQGCITTTLMNTASAM